MLKRWIASLRSTRWLAGGIVAVVLAAAVAWVLFVPVADWLAHHDVGPAREPLLQAARDAARGRLLTLGAGLLAAGALLFTARNFTLSREGQVTDRYTKAIEQLGSDKLDVRIGGIYALERIAGDSAKDHPTVMEVLTAFVREHSREPWPPPEPMATEPKRSIRPDVQAALTVIGRRDVTRDMRRIDLIRADLTDADLRGVDLTGADLNNAFLNDAHLRRAHLRRAELWDAHLNGARFQDADLTGASLNGARARSAVFTGADLTGALLRSTVFTGAHLKGAKLVQADLADADLTGADLSGADLSGADLTGARWPADAPVPEGWRLDIRSGRLTADGADSGPHGS